MQVLIGHVRPGEQEDDHDGAVDAVVEVLLEVKPVGKDERDNESTDKRSEQPGKLPASRGRKMA